MPSQFRRYLIAITAGLAYTAALVSTAAALSIELKDVAPDRIERQRAAVDGRLPLPNTPDTSKTQQRLQDAGLKSGSPIMLRLFKETSELELWMEKGDSYVLFATYPICHWSGTLGPKLREGDKQAPEGFYTISSRQLHHLGRWPIAIDVGFPNAFDKAHDRDGSYILMHGGCSSVGCFAMTNPVIGEIYGLAQAALRNEQRYIPVHVFPFRMSDDALAARASGPWTQFWSELAQGYRSFERTRRPPRVSVCKGEYLVEDAPPKAVAEEPVTENKKHKTDRSDLMLGAIRLSCPASQIVAADSKAGGPQAPPSSGATEPGAASGTH